jgi:hypothetical protein
MSNPIAKIAMFRARIMKTYMFHRITIKAPKLSRRWHLFYWFLQVFVLIIIEKLTQSDFILTIDT